MNIVNYSPQPSINQNTLKIGKKASVLIKKFHQSVDGLTLKNWQVLAEILDFAAIAEQTIADQKQYISNLESLASTDMLTGLLNRHGFEHEVQNAIAHATRYKERSLLAYFDLDNFKQINDTYGHSAGDTILKEVASVMTKSIRQTDAASRLSGDEFCILFTRCDIKKAEERAGYIRHILRKINLNYNGFKLSVGASMGVSIISSGLTLEEIFNRADKAMYDNKRQRKEGLKNTHLA